MNEDYSIICYTDEQRQVYKRCQEKMYKKYNIEEKNEIKKIIKEFI